MTGWSEGARAAATDEGGDISQPQENVFFRHYLGGRCVVLRVRL